MPSEPEPPLDAERKDAPSESNTSPERHPPLSSALQGRLHPLTLFFGILRGWGEIRGGAIQIIAPGVALYATSPTLFQLGIALLIIYPFIHAGVLYFTFQYGIEGEELVTRQGLLKRTERHVPLERVQDLRVEQNLIQQFFGVVTLYVETAGGAGPEATLSVISSAEAERLRETVFRHFPRPARDQEGEDESSRRLIRRLDTKDIFLAGLTSNRAASLLLFFGSLFPLLDEILPEAVFERVMDSITDEILVLTEQGVQVAFLVFFLFFLGAALLSIAVSVIGSLLLFYGFTLSKEGEDLHRSYGLLTRRSSSLPRRRIQVLEIEEGMLRRLFNLATLRADIAGGVLAPNSAETGRDVLLPILRREDAEPLLPIFFPDMEEGAPEWHRVSKRSILRGTMSGGILCVAMAITLTAVQGSWVGLWPLAFIPWFYFVNVRRYRNLGYALGERYFRTRRGWLGRSTHIVPIRNIQSVMVYQTFFERRMELATLYIDSAGQAFTGGGPHVSNLPVEEAEELARILAKRASESRFQWHGNRSAQHADEGEPDTILAH